jgi:hypothetical protein
MLGTLPLPNGTGKIQGGKMTGTGFVRCYVSYSEKKLPIYHDAAHWIYREDILKGKAWMFKKLGVTP